MQTEAQKLRDMWSQRRHYFLEREEEVHGVITVLPPADVADYLEFICLIKELIRWWREWGDPDDPNYYFCCEKQIVECTKVLSDRGLSNDFGG